MPMKVRVARHMTTFIKELEVFSQMEPSRAIVVRGIPSYQEMVDAGLGHFFHDPTEVPSERLYYD